MFFVIMFVIQVRAEVVEVIVCVSESCVSFVVVVVELLLSCELCIGWISLHINTW